MAFKTLATLLALVGSIQVTSAALTRRVACPDGVNTATNAACCSLFAARDDLQQNLFSGAQCNAEAHEAIRLIFHDAIAISNKAGNVGGADGSIMSFSDVETVFHPNIGLDEIVELERPFGQKHNLTSGDLIHFAGLVAITNCPGAPRIPFFFGRPEATEAAPDGLVPEPFHTVAQILDRFADAGPVGFENVEIVWALSAHSIAAADDVNPNVPGTPFDSTPSVFDTQFFLETQLRGNMVVGKTAAAGEVDSAIRGVMRLQSDHNLARDSSTACEWQSFVDNQKKLHDRFSDVIMKLTLLGHDQNTMVDCTEVLPVPQPFTGRATFPPGQNLQDVEQACGDIPFPVNVKTASGPALTVAPVKKNLS